MSDPIWHKGEKITCENGHVIGECVEDVYFGTMNWGGHFGNWTQEDHPRVGVMNFPKCAVCGAKFIDSHAIHSESGWK